jgi:molybdopterin/thiamine biosynthesis adenylyltransferase
VKHPFIIGAGGVASYLLPCLLKAFKPEKVTIIDKDVLEERNLDRQMFSHHDVGAHKADALVGLLLKSSANNTLFDVVTDWFTPTTIIPDDVDAIICVADNHEARRNAIRAAYERNIRCYIGGNEYFDAEAYVTWAEHDGTKLDPRVRYSAIATSHAGSPLRCQGEEQEIHPQLAIANYRCAGHIMHLLYAWERRLAELSWSDAEQMKAHLPIEIYSGLTSQIIVTTASLSS